MHMVAMLALHGVVPFDLAIPCGIFGDVRTADGRLAYDVRVCGETPTVKAGPFDIRVAFGLEQLASACTVLQWVLTERIRRAQGLLECTDLSIEQVAT